MAFEGDSESDMIANLPNTRATRGEYLILKYINYFRT